METIDILSSNDEESPIKRINIHNTDKLDEFGTVEVSKPSSSQPIKAACETVEKVPSNVILSSNVDESPCSNDLKNSPTIKMLPKCSSATSVSVEKNLTISSVDGVVVGGSSVNDDCGIRSFGTSTNTTTTTSTTIKNDLLIKTPQQKLGLVSVYKSPLPTTSTALSLTTKSAATTPIRKVITGALATGNNNPASKMAIIRRIKSKFQKKPTAASIMSSLPTKFTTKPITFSSTVANKSSTISTKPVTVSSTVATANKPSTQSIVLTSSSGDIGNISSINSTKLSVNIPNSITISKTVLNSSTSSTLPSPSAAISPNIIHHTAPNTITITNTSATKYTAPSLSSFTTAGGGISFVSTILSNKTKPTVVATPSMVLPQQTILPMIKKIDHPSNQTQTPTGSVLQIRKISTKPIVPSIGGSGVGVSVPCSVAGGILIKSVLTKPVGNLPKLQTAISSPCVATTTTTGGSLKVIIAKPTGDKPTSPNNPIIKLNSIIASASCATSPNSTTTRIIPVVDKTHFMNFTHVALNEIVKAKSTEVDKTIPLKIEQKLPMRPAIPPSTTKATATTISTPSTNAATSNINKINVQRQKLNTITTTAITTSVTVAQTTTSTTPLAAQKDETTENPRVYLPSSFLNRQIIDSDNKNQKVFSIGAAPNLANSNKKVDTMYNIKISNGKLSDPKGPIRMLSVQNVDKINTNIIASSVSTEPDMILIEDDDDDNENDCKMDKINKKSDDVVATKSTSTLSPAVATAPQKPQIPHKDIKKISGNIISLVNKTTTINLSPASLKRKFSDQKSLRLQSRSKSVCLAELISNSGCASSSSSSGHSINSSSILSPTKKRRIRRIRLPTSPGTVSKLYALKTLSTVSDGIDSVIHGGMTKNETSEENSIENWSNNANDSLTCEEEIDDVSEKSKSLSPISVSVNVAIIPPKPEIISFVPESTTELIAAPEPIETIEIVTDCVEKIDSDNDDDDDDGKLVMDIAIDQAPIVSIKNKEATTTTIAAAVVTTALSAAAIATVNITKPTVAAIVTTSVSATETKTTTSIISSLPQTIQSSSTSLINQAQFIQLPSPIKNQPKSIHVSPKTSQTQIMTTGHGNEKDPINYIKWRMGIGYLFNSNIHFKTNEFNLVEILNDNDFKHDHIDKKFEKTLNDDLIRSIFSSNIYKSHNPQTKPTNNPTSSINDLPTLQKNPLKPMLSVISDASIGQMSPQSPLDNMGIEGFELSVSPPPPPSTSSLAGTSKNRSTESGKQSGRKNLLPASRLRAVLRNTASSNSYATAQLVNKIATYPSSTSDQLQFSWNLYIKMTNTTPAPKHMFINPFPSSTNMFEVGMKLEAIDPEHNSLFCVCTIVQRIGYRIKLRFDGYNTKYDFWKNADSLDIFPPGWCGKTGRDLQPPGGYDSRRFEWSSYLITQKALAAPRIYFTHLNSSATADNPFKVGMKLEADDLKNSKKICVATVGDVLDNRILIQFDGWDGSYDYWTDITSPYIHPINWHMTNGFNITGPPDFKSPFKWDLYLNKTNSIPAPENIFCVRQPMGFWPGLQLEIVDKKNPSLIRPATIIDVHDYELKILFIGWSSSYAYWTDDDSTDIHPINWCNKTDHPIETPNVGVYSLTKYHSSCGVQGCREVGNAKRPHVPMHFTLAECPYELQNWTTECPQKTDRLKGVRIIDRKYKQLKRQFYYAAEKVTNNNNNNSNINITSGGDIENSNSIGIPVTKRIKIERLSIDENNSSMIGGGNNNKTTEPTSCGGGAGGGSGDSINNDDEFDFHVKEEIINDDTLTESILTPSVILTEPSEQHHQQQQETISKSKQMNIRTNTTASINKINTTAMIKENIELAKRLEISEKLLHNYGPNIKEMHKLWKNNTKILEDKISKTISDKLDKTQQRSQLNPIRWSVNDVVDYVSLIPNCKNIAKKFYDNEINGSAFLCLSQDDLTDLMDMRMGPAVKIYNQIVCLREDVNVNYIKTN